MKRYTSILLCLTLAAALLCGCGASPKEDRPIVTIVPTLTPAPEPTAAPAAKPTEEPTSAPEPTPIPTPVPTPTPTAVPTDTPIPTAAPAKEGPTAKPVKAGKYTYKAKNGTWTLQLRDDGLYLLIDPNGVQHAGESWITEADGTVTCGPTDLWDADFAFGDGCSRWKISGQTCKPVKP